jgi:hypothetical protein
VLYIPHLSQKNPIHTFTPAPLKQILILFPLLCLGLPCYVFSLRVFQLKFCKNFSHIISGFLPLDFITLVTFDKKYNFSDHSLIHLYIEHEWTFTLAGEPYHTVLKVYEAHIFIGGNSNLFGVPYICTEKKLRIAHVINIMCWEGLNWTQQSRYHSALFFSVILNFD